VLSLLHPACHLLSFTCITSPPGLRCIPPARRRPLQEEGWIGTYAAAGGNKTSAVFGDGSHATTRLCAAAVDLVCRQQRPQAVLDVGTGTGILARIARARGARFIVGTDIDAVALSCAHVHADLDGHAVEIQFGPRSPPITGARAFDLVGGEYSGRDRW